MDNLQKHYHAGNLLLCQSGMLTLCLIHLDKDVEQSYFKQLRLSSMGEIYFSLGGNYWHTWLSMSVELICLFAFWDNI